MSIAKALDCALQKREVPEQIMQAAFGEMMAGEAVPEQTVALLIAMRMKGESAAELAAAARALRARAETAPASAPNTVDTCGTGGDGAGTFNISTAAAIVAAGAGAPVAKHGNRAASSQTGSADVLAALGVELELSTKASAEVLAEVGVAFFFARRAHPAMRHVAPLRSALGRRTMMNCLGPLLNPAGAKRQLVGVYSKELAPRLAEVLLRLGAQAAWVVHGQDGLDEISTAAPTHVARIANGEIVQEIIDAQQLGIARAQAGDLRGGDAKHNAEILRAVLAGEGGPRADITALNAGAALAVAGKAQTLAEGLAQAREAIASGAAREKLAALIAATQKRAGQ